MATQLAERHGRGACAPEIAHGKLQGVTPTSTLYRLIDRKLDGKFDGWVTARRPAMSWQEIADEIYEATGERPTRETVRLWFADRIVTETRIAS
jgi:hypothetical protein